MKFLFIVQGEGRGHFTQAITLEEMLLHEVVEVLVGKSSTRTLPGFFNRSIHAPVKRFISPNFLPTVDDKRANLTRSFAYNLLKIPEYFRSMCYINQRIRETGAEVVINFYELLTGLTYTFFRPSVPYVCIGPLIRQEVIAIQPEEGNYIHGYMVNSGFADSVESFHAIHPEIPLKCFWDKADTEEVTKIDETLSFYQIDDVRFLNGMAGCRAYASTAGFESICEAMYLGKPVLMVPAHIEQDCNAYDAMMAGAGIVSDSFDLEPLLRFVGRYTPNRNFVSWVRSCERRIILELERTIASQSETMSIPTFTNYLPI